MNKKEFISEVNSINKKLFTCSQIERIFGDGCREFYSQLFGEQKYLRRRGSGVWTFCDYKEYRDLESREMGFLRVITIREFKELMLTTGMYELLPNKGEL